ncbi:hypothetical protein LTR84_007873 [Exophiala bonariae]|uniref:Uncharacterized protein n=1 Tax=Exophiala bonariae TaxID=1690606 RepID=A0AAV9NLB8_9EURO|nr:hypothetical protein LTR84_007873 [Exophiala bonariae]
MESLTSTLDAAKLQPGSSHLRKQLRTQKTLDFEGSVVLITGAASGKCMELIWGVWDMFWLTPDLSKSKLENTKGLLQNDGLYPQMELYEGDVSDEASVRGMMEHCVEVYGRIDVACNNAGISGNSQRTTDISVQDFDLICAVNERGVILCEKYELEQMMRQDVSFGNQRGVIVNTASIAGHCIIPTASAYTASKHAVVALTRCDALRHAQDAIRINCVSPAATWTPMISESVLPKEFIELGAKMAPMHRYAQPIEIVNAILFLAGPKATAITGVNLPVDCGNTLLRSTGFAIALACANHGCEQIILADGSPGELQSFRDKVLGQYPSADVHVEAFDRSIEDDVDRVFSAIRERFLRIDFAVNVVCQTQARTCQDLKPTALDITQYDRNFAIYQRGLFLIERALLRQMLKQDVLDATGCRGSIVNVVDYGPIPTLSNCPIVAAIANAIVGMSKTDACDFAQDNIRVNCVAASEVMITKAETELPGGVPLPRKGRTDDVANAVMWLLSSGANWLTGMVVPVDGGRSLNHFW